MSEQQSSISLIGERYLDTQHSPSYIAGLERELAARGITGTRRWLWEYIAASAFWWNIFWWEWCSLDKRDLLLGWGLNVMLFGSISFASLLVLPWWGALLTALALHLGTLHTGLSLRSGTILDEQEDGTG